MSVNKLNTIVARVLTTRAAWPILLTITALCTASILSLRLSSQPRADRQEIHILVGSIALLLCLLPHFQNIGRAAYGLYAIALLLLVAVLLSLPPSPTPTAGSPFPACADSVPAV